MKKILLLLSLYLTTTFLCINVGPAAMKVPEALGETFDSFVQRDGDHLKL